MEKWGRISGMLEGGSVNSTLNMYVLKCLFEMYWPVLSIALFFCFYLLVSESTDVVLYFIFLLFCSV